MSNAPRMNRITHACETCKSRKRKCNGQQPCETCIRYNYECHYIEMKPRKARKYGSNERSSAPAVENSTLQPDATRNGYQAMEANSGVALIQLLVSKLRPGQTHKALGFSWNLGIGHQTFQTERSITSIISQDEWYSLLDVFQQRILPVYDFVDMQVVSQNSAERWSNLNASNKYDHVLCGIAALGALFKPEGVKPSVYERLLVECAKEIIECNANTWEPTFEDAQALLLRTIYLRCSSPTYPAWLTSCTAMHVVEIVGAHRESSDASLDARTAEYRRRMYWRAKHLNSWISWEYGRSRVVLPGANAQAPTSLGAHDHTTDVMRLFQISEILAPENEKCTASQLELAIRETSRIKWTNEALLLSQANLCMTLYRRLRIAVPSIGPDLLQIIIDVGQKGLEASLSAAILNLPWWHVSNVPFQFICVLMAMDCKESLAHVNPALETFRKIAHHFDTNMTRQALDTIETLVAFALNAKESDANMLRNSLDLGRFAKEQSSFHGTGMSNERNISNESHVMPNASQPTFMLNNDSAMISELFDGNSLTNDLWLRAPDLVNDGWGNIWPTTFGE